jgi:hypothetical protein
MSDLWRWIVGVLVWLSSDAGMVERERPASAAAVTLARASMEPDKPARPAPRRCQKCDGKGFVQRGGRNWQCDACRGCPDGNCPIR